MGFPTSEVGYTSAMPRREDHEVHKDMWGHWTPPLKTNLNYNGILTMINLHDTEELCSHSCSETKC